MRHQLSNYQREIAISAAVPLVALLLLPSGIFYLLNTSWFLERAWINVDYLLLGVCVGILSRRLFLTAWFVIFLSDLVFAFAPAYHFSPASVIESLVNLFDLDLEFVLFRISVVILLTAILVWCVDLSLAYIRHPAVSRSAAILLAFLGVIADSRLAHTASVHLDSRLSDQNVAASTINQFRIAILSSLQPPASTRSVPAASAIQSTNAATVSTEDQPKLVLIVVESLGLFRDPQLQHRQLLPLLALRNAPGSSVFIGSIPFAGSTVSGELRELCGTRLLTVSPEPRQLNNLHCLPDLLRSHGYQTTAMHGYLGAMFSRAQWYPALGFDRVWFAPDLVKLGAQNLRCGRAFHGLCDEAVWRQLFKELQLDSSAPQFIYWLTLSAHLPLDGGDERTGMAECGSLSLSSPEVCALLARNLRLFRLISSNLSSVPNINIRLILVGDHQPPFIRRESRALFDATRVPFVDLHIVRSKPRPL